MALGNAGSVKVRLKLLDEMTPGLKAAEGNMAASAARFKSVGAGLTSAGKSLTSFVTAPIIAAAAATAKLASDAGENANKFNVVFRGSVDESRQALQELREVIPLSTGDIEGLASGLQDLLVPMGLQREAAAGMTVDFVRLAGDISSFNNVSPEQTINDIKAALLGSSEPISKYGVDTRVAALEAHALAAGLIEEGEAMDRATKAQAVMIAITKDTTDAKGDARRTAKDFAAQVKFLQSDLKQLGEDIGKHVIPIILPLIAKVREGVKWFSQLSKGTKESIVKWGLLAAAIGPVVIGIGSLATGIGSVLGLISGAGSLAAGAGIAGTAITGVVTLLTGPVGWIAALALLGTALYANREAIAEWWKEGENAKATMKTLADSGLTLDTALAGGAQGVRDYTQALTSTGVVTDALRDANGLLQDTYGEERENLLLVIDALEQRKTNLEFNSTVTDEYTKALEGATKAGVKTWKITQDETKSVAELTEELNQAAAELRQMAREKDEEAAAAAEAARINNEYNEVLRQAKIVGADVTEIINDEVGSLQSKIDALNELIGKEQPIYDLANALGVNKTAAELSMKEVARFKEEAAKAAALTDLAALSVEAIATQFEVTQEEAAELKEEFQGLADEANGVAEALTEEEQAILDLSESMGISVGEADRLIGKMSEYENMVWAAEESTRLANLSVTEIAEQFGLTEQEAGRLSAAFGVQAEEARKALEEVGKYDDGLSDAERQMYSLADAMGVSAFAAQMMMGESDKVHNSLAAAAAKAEIAALSIEEISEKFGLTAKQAADLKAEITKMPPEIQGAEEAFTNMNFAMENAIGFSRSLWDSFSQGDGILGKLAGGLSGITSTIGGLSGTFESLGASLSSMGESAGGLGGLLGSAGGLMGGLGEKMAGFTSMLGPWSAGISAAIGLIGPLIGGIKKLFGGPSAEELAGRKVAAGFRDSIDSMLNDRQRLEAGNEKWRQENVLIRDSMIAIGRTQAEGEALSRKFHAAEKEGAEATKAVIAEIQVVLDEVNRVTEQTGLSLDEQRHNAMNGLENIAKASHAACEEIVETTEKGAASTQAVADGATQAAKDAGEAQTQAATQTATTVTQVAQDAANAQADYAHTTQEAYEQAYAEAEERVKEFGSSVMEELGWAANQSREAYQKLVDSGTASMEELRDARRQMERDAFAETKAGMSKRGDLINKMYDAAISRVAEFGSSIKEETGFAINETKKAFEALVASGDASADEISQAYREMSAAIEIDYRVSAQANERALNELHAVARDNVIKYGSTIKEEVDAAAKASKEAYEQMLEEGTASFEELAEAKKKMELDALLVTRSSIKDRAEMVEQHYQFTIKEAERQGIAHADLLKNNADSSKKYYEEMATSGSASAEDIERAYKQMTREMDLLAHHNLKVQEETAAEGAAAQIEAVQGVTDETQANSEKVVEIGKLAIETLATEAIEAGDQLVTDLVTDRDDISREFGELGGTFDDLFADRNINVTYTIPDEPGGGGGGGGPAPHDPGQPGAPSTGGPGRGDDDQNAGPGPGGTDPDSPFRNFAFGSGGFQNFGSGTPAVLHGTERVQTKTQFDREEGGLRNEMAGIRADLNAIFKRLPRDFAEAAKESAAIGAGKH